MAGCAPLSGMSVLIVEDDYLIAEDLQSVLQQAGARVLGPCDRGDEAIICLAHRANACAVVDINLGQGPDFGLARTLRRQFVPFVFLTGYDSSAIPWDLRQVACIEKPMNSRELVGALARLPH